MQSFIALMIRGSAGLALLAAAACAPTQSQWSEAQAPKQNRVEPVRLLHDVRFGAGEQLSAVELSQLQSFMARHEIGYGDRVYVLSDASVAAESGIQRTAAVVNFMAAHGVKAAAMPSAEPLPGLVRVVVNRYVVVPPNCPDWSKPATADYGNTSMSNLGCANAANFGLMVADPGELVQGRAPGNTDATAAGLAIQRYRAGAITPLERSSTNGDK